MLAIHDYTVYIMLSYVVIMGNELNRNGTKQRKK